MAEHWLASMLAECPFDSLADARAASDAAIAALDDAGLTQALAAHARIGERREGSGVEDRWSRTEQAGALGAVASVASALADGNAEYQRRFGRIFLIRASGRSGEQILTELRRRLANDPDTEDEVVRRELAAIVRLRLDALAGEPGLIAEPASSAGSPQEAR